jgi:hypothetical protein
MSTDILPPSIPASIEAEFPFFTIGENGAYSVEQISAKIARLSAYLDGDVDYPQSSLGKVMAWGFLKVLRNFPSELGGRHSVGPAGALGGEFLSRLRGASPSFNSGFMSEFTCALQIALECPYLVPALGRVLDGLDNAKLNAYAVLHLSRRCVKFRGVEHKSIPSSLMEMVEAEHAAMAKNSTPEPPESPNDA